MNLSYKIPSIELKNIKLDVVQEFTNFIKKYGVLGLAIGTVVGSAVKTLVDSIVSNLITPLMGLLPNMGDLKTQYFVLGDGRLTYGLFLNDLISFLVLMMVVFFAIKFFISKFMSEEEIKKI